MALWREVSQRRLAFCSRFLRPIKITNLRKSAASLVHFRGEIFAKRLWALRFWILFSTLFFAVFKYSAYACRSKIAKSAILIKFANSPRTPCTVELHSVSNLASNLTRKLAAQRLAARQIYSNIKNGASSTFLIILNGESSASCRICVEYCGFCRVPRTLMTVESVRSLPSTI